jgi:predicted TIM-barrel fold metal-dependent hydrolase
MAFRALAPQGAYPRPSGDKLDQAAAGSDHDALCRQYLDPEGIERALLFPEYGMLVPVIGNARLGLEISRAANDWLLDHWLDGRDGRLYGGVVAPIHIPEEAAAEIRRVGSHPRIVGVVLSANPLGRPFGHPIYWPIYEAAAEMGLVLLIHAAGASAPETLTSATAAGPPAMYADHYTLLPQSLMSQVTSIIGQGIFERFPGLRVLLVGAGAAWVVPFLWRFDTEYAGMRIEAPWLEQRPSDYFRESVRVATYPLDPAPTPEQRQSYYAALPDLDRMLCFASGYPNWDCGSPQEIAAAHAAGSRDRILRTNALEFFPWDATRKAAVSAADHVSAG